MSYRNRFTCAVVTLIACVGALVSARVAGAADKPNIIVIMADDLGFGDISCNGATRVHTPNIDRLASEGLNFTSGYCSASTCTPTRYSFITGRFAFRDPGTGIAPPDATLRIDTKHETIASVLKRAGYATAVIGKWHLGLGEGKGPDWNGELKPGPNELGFDYCFLLPTTNDRVPQVYVENHRVVNLDPKDPIWVSNKNEDGQPEGKDPEVRKTLKLDWSHGHNSTVHNGIGRIGFYGGGKSARWRDEDLADKWIEKSTAWIEQHKDGPFFMFYAAHNIHVPRMPNERFQGKTPLGLRGDSIVELDWEVGQLLDTLDRMKLTDNTLIVFCSDNGPVLDDGYKDGAVEKLGDHKPAGDWSGGKYTVWEGGTRTPFITRWPGHIKPGVSDQIVCTIDLAASFAALTGVELPKGACVDSLNVLPALLGKADADARESIVQQGNSMSKLGYRVGGWKLIREAGGKKGKPGYKLYDLTTDQAEKSNVIDANPKVAERMIEQLESIIQSKGTRPGL
ncbi:MAG: sulfatase-like hydrolase/transferase [Phycisphaera sp.]|nr:sulfatase-like hydrolase/transferase [Phycisphaera sp.]